MFVDGANDISNYLEVTGSMDVVMSDQSVDPVSIHINGHEERVHVTVPPRSRSATPTLLR